MDKKRVQYIDIARGIAMICIVLGHLGNDKINRVVFTFHVPLFFFITGYFINSKLSGRNYIKKKARALLVPYCCTCLAIILAATMKNGIIYGSAAAKQTALEWIYVLLYMVLAILIRNLLPLKELEQSGFFGQHSGAVQV